VCDNPRVPIVRVASRDRFTFAFFLFQLYEIDENPKRKEFLDELFSYMQNRGKFIIVTKSELYVGIWDDTRTRFAISTCPSKDETVDVRR
jgi:hypothetical protein